MLMVGTMRGMGHSVCAIAAMLSAAATRHLPGLMIVGVHLQDDTGPAAVRKTVALNGFEPRVFVTEHEVRPGDPWPDGTMIRKPVGAMEGGQAIQHVPHVAPPGTAGDAMALAGIDGSGR